MSLAAPSSTVLGLCRCQHHFCAAMTHARFAAAVNREILTYAQFDAAWRYLREHACITHAQALVARGQAARAAVHAAPGAVVVGGA